MTISRLTATVPPPLDDLVSCYPFHQYRAHKILDLQDIRALTLDKVLRQIRNSIATFHSSSTNGDALAIAEMMQWDTEHFGFPNYRINLFQAPDVSDVTLSELIALACGEIRSRHGKFNISMEIDEMDYMQINAAIRQGFQLRDSKRIYVARNAGHRPTTDIRNLYVCREYRESDRGDVLKLLQGISFPSRFTRDPNFSADKVAEMYEIWTNNLLHPPYHNRPVLIVENSHHDVVAFGTGQDINLGARHEIKTLCGNGLFFGNPQFPGSYLSFLQYLRTTSIRNYKAFELIVSASNLAAIRALEMTGFNSTPGRYSFHLNNDS